MNLQPFQLVMIASITAHLMVAAMFMTVRRMLPTRAAAWWMTCSLGIATSYTLALLFYDSPPSLIGDIAFYVLNMLSISGMYIGCREFLGHTLSLRVLGRAFATMLGGVLCCTLIIDATMIADILFSVYCSYLMFSLAVYFYHDHSAQPRLSKALAALLLVVCLHWLDYPFLHGIEWFAPIGFLAAMVLSIAISLLFSALVLSKFQAQLILSEQRAIHDANHDGLTGLCNRSFLEQQFRERVRRAQSTDTAFSVIYIDLDGFKAINDVYGHPAGDTLLKEIAQRFKCKFGDKYTIARVGGDEFVLLSSTYLFQQVSPKENLTQQLLDLIEQPAIYNQTRLTVSASIGSSFYPLHGHSLTMLMEKADTAMYRAKKERRQQRQEQYRGDQPMTQKTVADESPATNRPPPPLHPAIRLTTPVTSKQS